MKFAHKIVVAASLILLISLGLLSTYQYFQVKAEINNQVDASTKELVTALSHNIEAVIETKSDITNYAASLVGDDFSKDNILKVLNQPVMKRIFYSPV